jgi:predicted amidophosphoribosyltransferase
MLSKAALDANPEMKTRAASFTTEICQALRDKIGGYLKNTVVSLVKNLAH